MKVELPIKKKYLHSFEIRVRWGEMDAIGHVNNANYFRFMETARVSWLSSIGIELGKNNQSYVIANTFCNFIHPTKYPDTLKIDTFVSNVGKSSTEFLHEFYKNSSTNKMVAFGICTAVWVDLKSGKGVEIPKKLKSFLV